MHLSDCVLVTQPCPAVPEQKDDGRAVLIRVPAVQKRRLLLDSGWILNVVPTQCLVARGRAGGGGSIQDEDQRSMLRRLLNGDGRGCVRDRS